MLVLPFKEAEAHSGDSFSGLNEGSMERDTFARTSNSEKLVSEVQAHIDFFLPWRFSLFQLWQVNSHQQLIVEEMKYFNNNNFFTNCKAVTHGKHTEPV